MKNTSANAVSGVSIKWSSEVAIDHEKLVRLLKVFGDLLPIPLSERMDLSPYASKLLNYADVAIALKDREVVGLIGMYANDQERKIAFISFLAILPREHGLGIGRAMMTRAAALSRQRGMRAIDLEVKDYNKTAVQLYKSLGFVFTGKVGNKCTMTCPLPSVEATSSITPVEVNQRLPSVLDIDIDLRIKRDDLYPMAGGGIKARKIEYIMRDLIANGHDVIVTNGGPQSNHARAASIIAAKLGIKCHLVIVMEPGIQYLDTGNIMLMRLSFAEIEYCTKEQLAERMDRAMDSYRRKGHNPLYVWGGGHCLAGTIAFVDAAAEARQQCSDWEPDYLVIASGTGSTQAGLAIGYARSNTRVIGISVAREKERGSKVVKYCVDEYIDVVAPGFGEVKVDFRDDWTAGGYERTSHELLETIKISASTGVLVDPTYSGKGLHGLVSLVRSGEIGRGSKVLFWHSGGLMNLQASSFAGKSICLP